ncbi:hypothetical protein [Nocardia alni]|uniref:hypothetical protein n=1 Tax=Nocardia alni TaxID=2815723 RepID=UPI001C21640B|nr:hypothetical protein [Nocardia alni]
MVVIELFDEYTDAFEIHTLHRMRADLRQSHSERNQSITDRIARAWLRCNDPPALPRILRALSRTALPGNGIPSRPPGWRIRPEIILAEADRVAVHAETLEDTGQHDEHMRSTSKYIRE